MSREKSSHNRLWVCLGIGLLATVSSWLLSLVPGLHTAFTKMDYAFYDALYRMRAPTLREDSGVVLIEVDQSSLDQVQKTLRRGWPWPRESWGLIASYMQKCGAKAVVYDMLFLETSAAGEEDDADFANALDQLTIPIVLAQSDSNQKPVIAPTRPLQYGFVDVGDQSVENTYRTYDLSPKAFPSLALAALRAAGIKPAFESDVPFLLHYHGPRADQTGKRIYRSIPAFTVISDAMKSADKVKTIEPSTFKDKIILIGPTAAGLHDLKSTPTDGKFPGVQVHATAIDNLIHNQQVQTVGEVIRLLVTGLLASIAAAGSIIPRRSWIKLLLCTGALLIRPIVSYALFMGIVITWMPIAVGILAIISGCVLGLVWSYRVENKQARFFLRALGQCVSPEIVQQLASNPNQLTVGGRAAELTVMFTDLQGFTELTEKLQERIEPVLNTYLKEMSDIVLDNAGTLDKYIGDAIMAFWNAPLDQADHAVRACRSALDIHRKDAELEPGLQALGADVIATRIGIHTGKMIVGFTGSDKKLNYTAIGDGVNLAARLEPANKIYHTHVIASDVTYQLAKHEFHFRKLDVMRVKGKNEPMPVYELICRQTELSPFIKEYTELYERAFAHYQKQQWDEAEKLLTTLLLIKNEDGPANVLLERIAAYKQNPPDSNWDGVYTSKTK